MNAGALKWAPAAWAANFFRPLSCWTSRQPFITALLGKWIRTMPGRVTEQLLLVLKRAANKSLQGKNAGRAPANVWSRNGGCDKAQTFVQVSHSHLMAKQEAQRKDRTFLYQSDIKQCLLHEHEENLQLAVCVCECEKMVTFLRLVFSSSCNLNTVVILQHLLIWPVLVLGVGFSFVFFFNFIIRHKETGSQACTKDFNLQVSNIWQIATSSK